MTAIAAITILETVRRRVVAIVAVATLVVVVVLGWGFHRLADALPARAAATGAEAVLTILVAFAFSVLLGIGAAFLAAPAIAWDLESGTALAVLPRPISRSAYVAGKWLGVSALVVAFGLVAGGSMFAAIRIGCGYRVPHVPEALLFLVAQSIALLTLALALGTRLAPLACGIVSIASFGTAWIAGITAGVASALHATALATAAQIVGLIVPTDGLWRGAVYALSPVIMLASEAQARGTINPFGSPSPPPPAFLIWSAAWVVAVFAGAIAGLRHRDI